MAKKFYQHPTYKFISAEEIETPVGRLVWLSLVKPKDAPPPNPGENQGAPRYEANLAFPKATSGVFVKQVEELAKAMLFQYNETAKQKLGEGQIFYDGDTADHEKYPYYKDCWVLTARNTTQPACVDAQTNIISPASVLGGMKGRLAVIPRLIVGHGIKFKLLQVQVGKDDGVRFGGALRDPATLLGVLEDDDDDSGESNRAPVEQPAMVAASKDSGTVTSGKKKAISLL